MEGDSKHNNKTKYLSSQKGMLSCISCCIQLESRSTGKRDLKIEKNEKQFDNLKINVKQSEEKHNFSPILRMFQIFNDECKNKRYCDILSTL